MISSLSEYEAAKSEFRDNGSLRAERLKAALLEYRRQHNIFEVGDFVVNPSGFFDWLYKVAYHCTENRIMLYKHDRWVGDTAYESWPFISDIRHATDVEIKAGKRLEVKSEN